ncbi:hypothetical protein PACTADRAFT_43910 [Pachysolen tannophilus NRRL Y-2460]|uniref:Peptidase M16 N-terminal domain-containing protein n=1 Tax=Pachysolen tannophilus NRRL Y-2460 TaxID=669874 RepID=A0A1E4TSJ4_PACTA|nr:hypothetical protein PACTADRAFT_43910 [Pachysolen tannophilus NRRL Y-2460]
MDSVVCVKNFDQNFLVPLSISNRSHKVIQLPNGLLVLLISDPTEDLASAALTVATGAHADPDDIPGLAHFCEHMIFRGTKEFNDPDYYQKLIESCGGRNNAFTTGEQTSFFFEIPTKNVGNFGNQEDKDGLILEKILRVFASFFKNPLFNELSIQREIHAIDNEHTSNKISVNKILYHGIRLISNKNHPFHRFATGNFVTLYDIPTVEKLNLRENLINFYENEYSSDKMTLVLRSPQSVNQLQKFAISYFSDVGSITNKNHKNNRLNLEDFSICQQTWKEKYTTTQVFLKDETSKCIFIKRLQSSSITPTIRINFPLSYDPSANQKKIPLFTEAWCQLYGDESSNSICDALKKMGYIITLLAFKLNLAEGNDTLTLELKLTNLGYKNLDQVLKIIFKFTHNVINGNIFELGEYLSEISSIDCLKYLYEDVNKSPMSESSLYSRYLQCNLKNIGPHCLLKGSPIWHDYDHDFKGGFTESKEAKKWWTSKAILFKEFLNESTNLNNFNFVILISNDTDINSISCIKKELKSPPIFVKDNYFQFDYSIFQIDTEKLSNLDSFDKSQILYLPSKNPFLPSMVLNHSCITKELKIAADNSASSSLSFITKNHSSSIPPLLLQEGNFFQLWYKKETNLIYSSRCYLSFEIVNKSISTCLNSICIEILAELIYLNLQKTLYQSETIGYTWEILPSSKGDSRIGVTISGFSEGVELMLKIIVCELQSLISGLNEKKLDYNTLRKARVAIRTRYENIYQENGIVLANSGLIALMEENIWSLEERLNTLEELDLQNFKEFVQNFFKVDSNYLNLLVEGDIETSKVEQFSKLINKLIHHLNSSEIQLKLSEPSTYYIPKGRSYLYSTNSPPGDPSNTIVFFIQTGLRSDVYCRTLTKVLANMISTTLIPELRNKRQLGYVVFGGLRQLRKTLGLHITILSGDYKPVFLENKIFEYLQNWFVELSKMKESDFKKQVLRKFINSYLNGSQKLDSSGGPSTLTMAQRNGTGFSNNGDALKKHKIYWEQIASRSYNFNNLLGEDDIDLSLVEKVLSKQNFLSFFNEKILSSKTRSSLSLHLKTSMSEEEISKEILIQQLDALLRLKGLKIPQQKLIEIVNKSNGNLTNILKELLKYFINQGCGLKLCNVIIREIAKQLGKSLRYINSSGTKYETNNFKVEVEHIEITNITKFHKQLKFIT